METRQIVNAVLAVLLSVCLLDVSIAKKLTETTEENCEVCVKFLTKFIDSLDSDSKGKTDGIETAFRKYCKDTKKDDNRFCYYVGGLEESATGMLGAMSKPVSWGMPADKVCMKLYKIDEQICDLRYDKQLDLANVDLKKLKVKDLKAILEEWDSQCKGCTEKTDYIQLIEELMPKYAPDAAAKRKAAHGEL